MPPPAPDQADSVRLPTPTAVSEVPPTATTLGDTEGQATAAPESPVAAR